VTKKKYHVNKRCTKMVDKKMLKNPMEKKKISKIYQRTKVQKMKGLENPSMLSKVET